MRGVKRAMAPEPVMEEQMKLGLIFKTFERRA